MEDSSFHMFSFYHKKSKFVLEESFFFVHLVKDGTFRTRGHKKQGMSIFLTTSYKMENVWCQNRVKSFKNHNVVISSQETKPMTD